MANLYVGSCETFGCFFGKSVDGVLLFVWLNPERTLGQ
jgi:hypothetical protein